MLIVATNRFAFSNAYASYLRLHLMHTYVINTNINYLVGSFLLFYYLPMGTWTHVTFRCVCVVFFRLLLFINKICITPKIENCLLISLNFVVSIRLSFCTRNFVAQPTAYIELKTWKSRLSMSYFQVWFDESIKKNISDPFNFIPSYQNELRLNVIILKPAVCKVSGKKELHTNATYDIISHQFFFRLLNRIVQKKKWCHKKIEGHDTMKVIRMFIQ